MDQTEMMKKIWGGRKPGYIDGALLKHASVVLPMIGTGDSCRILFEVRAGRLSTQPGEICFPGGAVEPGEDPEEAAVRETQEELLIDSDQIEVLAPLDRLLVPASITVHPFLAVLKNYENTYSAAEVDHIFTVPLGHFLTTSPVIHHTAIQPLPEPTFPYEWIPGGTGYKWRQGSYDVLFYKYEENIIWGMTAKILYSFIEMYKNAFHTDSTGE